MRRLIVCLALLASVALTMGAGWLSGPRFGPMAGPGFAQVRRVSVAQDATITYAEDIPGCVLALYAENYASGSVGEVATWADISSAANHMAQDTEIYKPMTETYAGITTVRTGPTTMHYVSTSALKDVPTNATEGTYLVAIANRMSTGGHYYAFSFGSQAISPGDARSVMGFEWGDDRSGNSYDIVDNTGGSAKDDRLTGAGIMAKDPAVFTVVGMSFTGTSTTCISSPTVTLSLGGYSNRFFPNDPYGGKPSKWGSVGRGWWDEIPPDFHDANFFSVHLWNRALSQSELQDAYNRIQAAIARGHR